MSTPDEDRWDITKAIILTSFSLMMLLTIGLTGTSCYLMIMGRDVPELLQTLTASAISFMFGTLAAMVKDFIKV